MISASSLKLVLVLAVLLEMSVPAFARDVAFVEPGSNSGTAGTPEEAFKIEPKNEIDVGDSIVNIVRRETLFFVNQTSTPIKVEKVALSSDSTVTATMVNDDCSKESTIPPLSRCSIEFSLTPTGPGSWGIELLMTHNGPGRITRAKVTGKTGGSDQIEKRDHGLFLSSKDVKPVDFGEVTAGEGKIVRSAVMVNDSPTPITLYSVDVVEADKTLQRLDSGCTADMELKPSESCPVTLVWTPVTHGIVSTDLIIRHSGQAGFAVIPIRGVAKVSDKEANSVSGGSGGVGGGGDGGGRGGPSGGSGSGVPPPPTPNQVAREVARATGSGGRGDDAEVVSAATGSVHLIGTVGNRAILLRPDGSTVTVQAGDSVDLGDATPAKVESISSNKAILIMNGKSKELSLEAVQQLKDKAAAMKKASSGRDVAGTGGKENTAGGLGASGGGLGAAPGGTR